MSGPDTTPNAGNADHLDTAMDWLLNSRYLDQPIVDHFWHIADGNPCDCKDRGVISPDD